MDGNTDLINTAIGAGVGIYAIDRVSNAISNRRSKAAKRTTKGKGAVKRQKANKSTTPRRSKPSIKGKVVHKGARGGKYIMRYGRRVYV